MTVITRFPPSPTGFMHIGNARTALFNWLYARAKGGEFVLRIEDTDKERSTNEAVDCIFESLQWLGLDYDNDAVVYQSKRLDRHVEVAAHLLAEGKAYHCYCTPAELDAMREEARAQGKPPVYNRTWRDKDASDAPSGINPVIRLKAPIESSTIVEDLVQGRVEVDNTQIDDYILVRSDGSPTYMLSVVVDDHDMGITHILRGDDHLNNAFRQTVLFEAMGWDVPHMGHLPLITGDDGSKYSKRHGAVGVLDFRDMGILPEALRNYLMRLGWGHGDDEIISTEQAIEWFDTSGINKSPAKFDVQKLEHLNAHYINECDDDRLIEMATSFYECETNDLGFERAQKSIEELKSRSTTLIQFAHESAFYHKSVPFDYDEKAQGLIADGQAVIKALITAFETADTFDGDTIKSICKSVAKDHANGKMGKVGMPLRAAITGTTVSPTVFNAAAILGRDETLARLKATLSD